MAQPDKNERRTPTKEAPQGHHDAHQRPRAPYGLEEHLNEELEKRHEAETPPPPAKPRDRSTSALGDRPAGA